MDVSNPTVILSEYKKCFKTLKIFQNSCHHILLTMIKHSLRMVKKHIIIKSTFLIHTELVGYLGLKKYLSINPEKIGVFLETAHPIKFSKDVEEVIKIKLDIPEEIKKILLKEKKLHRY